ncbi:MAG: response regulator [Lachnospiraceae bacterium]|nr:response regulator [Lachnospiraceae bacterium]
MDRVLLISTKVGALKDLEKNLAEKYHVATLPMSEANMLSAVGNAIPDCIIVYVESISRQKLFSLMDLREDERFAELPLLLLADDEDREVFEKNIEPKQDYYLDRRATNPEIRLCIEEMIATSDRQKHILIVDDDVTALKTVRSYLDERYRVTGVKSGRLAIKFLERQLPDCILLDCFMPDLNGAQTLQIIRSMENGRRVPVVFLTGVSDKQMVLNCLSLHPNGFLLKPVKRDDLMSKINEVI